jgi:hypothetical protein
MLNLKYIVFLLILFISYPVYVSAEFDPFPQNRGTIYDYGDDIPDVCFFGESPRWDGNAITGKDWLLFTDFQRFMFVEEVIINLLNIDVQQIRTDRLVLGLNAIAQEFQDQSILENLKMILLNDEGNVSQFYIDSEDTGEEENA